MSRVHLLSEASAPLTVRRWLKGEPGSLVASLAQVPELLEVTLPFVSRTLGASSLCARTKEIVILRTSVLLGCRFCVETHTVAALDSGLSRDEVVALRDAEAPFEVFDDPAERALLAWTEEVALGRGPVSAEAAEALSAHWPDHAVVELTLLVGATMMLNRYCTALELPTAPARLRRLAEEGLS